MAAVQTTTQNKDIKTAEEKKTYQDSKGYFQAVGRRKESVARVRLFKGQSQLIVNELPISQYFGGLVAQKTYQKPFELLGLLGQYTATIKVVGGGTSSQLDAVVSGIAKSLEQIDKDKFRPVLKKAHLLSRDARVKERRKFGFAHKARARKQSPKR